MHWRHRFPMLFIKLSDTGIEAKTRHRVNFNSCKQPLCQDSKDVFRSEINSIRSKPCFFPDTPQQSQLGESCIIIHQMKSLPIAAAYGRTYGSRISSRYLRPVTVPPWNKHGQCGHRARSLPKPIPPPS
ncbi:hypothetical protein TNCV_5044841 [Trichonephila clavipes]|uniref:Uncharacterized protein n=1 Tax=Trichonephila clavipes TaxID=2585209 RepID=A0A8X6WHL4_TRICX|nr:hypothetical protein TNCV_5044841 [Trichonephila clavipes]